MRFNMYSGNQNANMTEHEKCIQKYSAARTNLLAVLAFTLVNVAIISLGSTYYFLFSAQIPYFCAFNGRIGYEMYENASRYLITWIGISVITMVPYLLCWIFSKKSYKWMIGALCYFALDCVFLIISFDISVLLDVAFHAWVVYYLVIGVKYGKIWQDKYNFAPYEEPPINKIDPPTDYNGSLQ